MKIDELIELYDAVFRESRIAKTMPEKYELAFQIALAAIKAHKQGFRMCELSTETANKDGDMDFLPIENELTRLLEGLE